MIRLLFFLLLPSVALAQFGAFERDFIVAKSNFTATTGITLGGVTRTTWPTGGSSTDSNAIVAVSGPLTLSQVTNGAVITYTVTLNTNSWSFGGSGSITNVTSGNGYITVGNGTGPVVTVTFNVSDLLTTNAAAGLYLPISGTNGLATVAQLAGYLPVSGTATVATVALGSWPTQWAGSAVTSAVASAGYATVANTASNSLSGWPTTWDASAITSGVLPYGRVATNVVANGVLLQDANSNRVWTAQGSLSVGTATFATSAGSGWPTQWSYTAITNAPWLLTTGGTITGNLTVNSNLSANAGTFTHLTISSGGTLTVNGVQNNVLNIYTTVNQGTNYTFTDIYTTNWSYIYQATNLVVTNTVTTYVNIGGEWNATNAAWVGIPHLSDTKAGSAVATGAWDWTGATWVKPPTNSWTFGTQGALTNETDPVWSSSSNLYVRTASLGSAAYSNANAFLPTGYSDGAKANSNNTISVVLNGTTNSVVVGVGGVIDLGNLAAVTGSVTHAVSADYATLAGSASNVVGLTTGSLITTNNFVVSGATWVPSANGGTLTVAAAQGGLTTVAISGLAFSIPSGSTATRVGVDYDLTQTVTNDTLRKRAYAMYDSWSTNQQFAIDCAAYSGTATTTVLVLMQPVASTTNWPTSFAYTGTVTAISGTLNWSTAVTGMTNGLYDIQLLNTTSTGRTNLLRNLLRRQAQ